MDSWLCTATWTLVIGALIALAGLWGPNGPIGYIAFVLGCCVMAVGAYLLLTWMPFEYARAISG